MIAPAECTDHVIRVEDGGAPYDERNLMSLCSAVHNSKSGMEAHRSILVDYDYNEDGDKVPCDREDVYNVFKDNFREDV